MHELDAVQGEIVSWLSRAKTYVQTQNAAADINNQLNIGNRAYKRLEAYDALENSSQAIMDRSILFEGYTLLNRLGEMVRGENSTINYSITVTGSGDWDSSAIGEVITWEVDYSILKDLVTTSRTRIIMADSNSIMQALQQQTNLSKTSWQPEEIKLFNEFHEWANEGRGDKLLNRGNTLEAFLRLRQNNPEQLYNKEAWQIALNETLSNSLPFYAGGDIGNLQVKGMNASVANLGTMINALSRTHKNILTLKSQILRLSQKPPKTASSAIRLNNAIQKSIQRLLSQYGFTSG